MIRLIAREEDVRLARRQAEFFERLPQLIGSRQRRAVQSAVARGFQRNFSSQSGGTGRPWEPLALITQAERRRQGYAGARPILVRSGRYRDSLVNPDSPDHFSEVTQTATGIVFEEGSNSELVNFHEGGSRFYPPRPATELSQGSEDELGRVLDWIVESLERQYAR